MNINMKTFTVLLMGTLIAATPTMAANLISAYTFDEGTGDMAGDAIRVAAGDATLLGGVEWSTGYIGGGVTLDGIDDWLSAVNPIANGSEAMSFSGWVKADSLPVWSSIVKNWGGAEAGQYHFGIQAGEGDLSNFLFNSDGAVNNIREGANFATDVWTHVAFTFGNGKHKLFKDGAKIAEADYSGSLNFPLTQQNDGTGILGLGVKTNDAGSAPDPGAPGFWDGSFDDFGFWDGELSEQDVAAIYQNGTNGVSIVPEPSSLILVLFGIAGFARMRRLP